MTASSTTAAALGDIKVVDVDTHLTEPADLWTSRAPAKYRDRVPRVVDVEGVATWVFDGVLIGRAGGGSVVKRDGSKWVGADFIGQGVKDIHPGASNVAPRLEVMDELGIWAQIVYPNVVGLGGQRVAEITDPTVRTLAATLWNDAMAELQEQSGQRLFLMALVPWWDVDAALAEIDRLSVLGLRGVNTTADPQNQGLPDLGDRHWDPMWEACADRGLPVNFHIGSSETLISWFTNSPWPTQGADQKLALGSAMIYLSNARVLGKDPPCNYSRDVV